MNRVMNFSWHRQAPVREGLRHALVPASMDAALAAELAEINSFDMLVVLDPSGQQVGLFFPQFLREHLPSNRRVAGLKLPARLSDAIKLIDQFMPDFHSEDVNFHPRLYECSNGPHVTSKNPCSDHHIPTTPY